MRYLTFSLPPDRRERLGVVSGDRIIDVAATVGDTWPWAVPVSLLTLIDQGPEAWSRLRDRFEGGRSADAVTYATSAIRWHAPITQPRRNIICLGLNYAEHIREGAVALGREAKIPSHPVFFSKLPTTVSGPFDDIAVDPAVTTQVDWEAELGVIIGVAGRNIRRAGADSHIFGYTVVNDLSARDLQFRHRQWLKGKSLDGFCPMGPVVVTPDEFGDPQQKRIALRVNGVTKQDGDTRDMIFSVPAIIESFSLGTTLQPGDIISTGTPDGVGFSRTPPEFLRDGDELETEVEGIGTLRNRVYHR